MQAHTFHILAPKEEAYYINQAANAVVQAVEPVACANTPWACTFKFADNAEVQHLNKNFRGKDKPTNVLSFPAGEGFNAPDEPFYLGDIIFAHETVQQEAHTQNKTYKDHLTHLAVHGLLHLYGYDHMAEEEAIVMETLEILILRSLNIKNPYKISL